MVILGSHSNVLLKPPIATQPIIKENSKSHVQSFSCQNPLFTNTYAPVNSCAVLWKPFIYKHLHSFKSM